jgi:acyl-CoA dehydrogenase
MNFEPIAEHDLLRESVRHFFERELPEARIREMDRARRIPRSLWKRFAAMGWMGLSVPTEFGGSGADFVTAAVFCEELGRRFPSLATDWLLVSMTARVLREFDRPQCAAVNLTQITDNLSILAVGNAERHR